MRRKQLGRQEGFTLVEVLMAAFILVVGILGVVSLVDRANGAIGESNARVGATNLARELVEHTRGLDYDKVTPGKLPGLLEAKVDATSAGNPFTVVRRNVEYTVTISACLFDDPADGLAAVGFTTGDADRPMCTRPAAINADTDTNPDDFRRIVVEIDWKYRGAKEHHVAQDALIVNPSGGLGPRITAFPPPSGQITTGTAPSGTYTFTGVSATTSLSTTPARAVRWNITDGSAGDAVAVGGTTSATAWKITWHLGVNTDPTYVYDGTYTISAQAFSDLGVPGNLWANPILVNRYLPRTPTGFVAGRNPLYGANHVEMRWSGNPEGDIIGYRVYRLELTGTRTPITCPGQASALTDADARSCRDDNAPAIAATYLLVAVDRSVIGDSASAPRESPSPAVSTAVGTAIAPAKPITLTVTTEDDLPRLAWTQPSGEAVAYYRIYRDGDTLADRYARTVTASAWWVDAEPEDTANPQHTYRIAAVGVSEAESALSDPITWPDEVTP